MAPRRALVATALAATAWAAAGLAFSAPSWWRRGVARRDLESKSELELMAQLAVLLMPSEPIEELFRSFPAPKGWRHEVLLPDLATYGVLQEGDAALFVEYDGHPSHERRRGDAKDRRKNEALLQIAPPQSVVVRIGHMPREAMGPQVLYIQVPTWQRDEDQSLTQILSKICSALLKLPLAPDTSVRLLRQQMENRLSASASDFAERRRFDNLLHRPRPGAADDEDDGAAERQRRALAKLYKSWGS